MSRSSLFADKYPRPSPCSFETETTVFGSAFLCLNVMHEDIIAVNTFTLIKQSQRVINSSESKYYHPSSCLELISPASLYLLTFFLSGPSSWSSSLCSVYCVTGCVSFQALVNMGSFFAASAYFSRASLGSS